MKNAPGIDLKKKKFKAKWINIKLIDRPVEYRYHERVFLQPR